MDTKKNNNIQLQFLELLLSLTVNFSLTHIGLEFAELQLSTICAGFPQLCVNDTSVRDFLRIVVSSPGANPKYHNGDTQQSLLELSDTRNDN